MSFTPYHNIDGSSAQEVELIGINDILRGSIKSIHLNNIHTSSAATIDLYLNKFSTDTTAEESYFILHNYSLGAKNFLTIDNLALLNFDNSTYALFVHVGSSDTVDIFLNK